MIDIGIINNSLTKIGEPIIASVKDGDKLGVIYLRCLKYLLSLNAWNFAIKDALTSPTDVMNANKLKIHQLPTECLRVLNVSNSDGYILDKSMYEVRGKTILTPMNNAIVRYVAYIEDNVSYSEEFKELFASYMAYEICLLYRQSMNRKQIFYDLYERQLRRSALIDAQQNPNHKFKTDDWITKSRF